MVSSCMRTTSGQPLRWRLGAPALSRGSAWAMVVALAACGKGGAEPATRASTRAVSSATVDAGAASRPAAAGTATDPMDVSMIELIAAPERFRHRWVRLMGFAALEFEGNAVYLHQEDYDHSMTRNALWLDTRGAKRTQAGGPGYSIVEGQFEPDLHGHMDLFAGGLSPVQRLTAWPGRAALEAAPK